MIRDSRIIPCYEPDKDRLGGYGHRYIQRQKSEKHPSEWWSYALPRKGRGKNGRMGASTEWEYGESLAFRAKQLRESGFDAYCLFSLSGSEVRMAQELNRLNEACIALPFLRSKRAGTAKKSFFVQEVLLPGYVFVFAPKDYPIGALRAGEFSYRVLDRKENGGLLGEEDRKYAEWVLSQGGILSVSQAIKVNDRVTVVSGPLLALQGFVTAYAKSSQKFKVKFQMMGRDIEVWLPFELIRSE